MNKLEEVTRFCNLFFAHPAWQKTPENTRWMRLSYLPSDYLLEKDPGAKANLKNGKNERTIEQKQLAKEARSIVGVNEKGWDSYYFLNKTPQTFLGSLKSAQIERRLFLPVDIDYRLPLLPEELMDELGVRPTAIVVSSEREFPRYQFLFGIGDYESEGAVGELAAELCNVLGGCPVHDAKRIFRMPGTINWKGAKRNGELKGASLSRIYSSCEGLVWDVGEIGEAVREFGNSKLSRDLRLLSMPSAVGAGGEGGGHGGSDFGYWGDALESARTGKWSVRTGARHNALCLWGVQMCSARLPWEQVRANLEELRKGAFETAYNEVSDYKRLVHDVHKKWEEIDAELAAGDAAFEEEIDWSVVGLEVAPGTSEKSGHPGGSEVVEGVAGTSGEIPHSIIDGARGDRGAREKRSQPAKKPKPGNGGKARARIEPIGDFAKRLSYQAEGESEEGWIEFLAKVLAAVNEHGKDKGNLYRVVRVLVERLEWAGAARGRYYAVPLYFEETNTWTMQPLQNEDQAKLLVSDFFMLVSERVSEQREKVRVHARVVAATKGMKKPVYVFAARGPLLNSVVTEVIRKASGFAIRESARRIDRDVIAFQNGVLRLDVFERAGIDTGWEEKVGAAWTANPEEPENLRGVRRGLSWIDNDYALSCSLDVESLREREIEAKKWDRFTEEAFPGDTKARELLERIIGYCFLVDNPYQKYFYFEGKAGGGKGTTAELILSLVGSKNSSRVQFDRILSDAWLGPLNGKTAVLIDEAENEDPKVHRKVTSELARVTGQDRTSARLLYGDASEIYSTQKFILTTNRSLQTDDAAGQQSRRIVPVNFAHVPRGKVVPRLYAQIVEEDGGAIATRGIWRLLECMGLEMGTEMFVLGLEESEAVSKGRERFEESTAGIRKFLELVLVNTGEEGVVGAATNLSRGLLRILTEVWIRNQEHRKELLRGLDKKLVVDLERLGFTCSKEAAAVAMPERALAMGYPKKSRAVMGARINTEALLEALDMSPEEICRAVRRATVGKQKEWFTAQSALAFDGALFAQVEGEIHWDESEVEEDSSKWRLN